jgi:hypothetical protein
MPPRGAYRDAGAAAFAGPDHTKLVHSCMTAPMTTEIRQPSMSREGFQVGHPRYGGRQKGTRNKVGGDLREAIVGGITTLALRLLMRRVDEPPRGTERWRLREHSESALSRTKLECPVAGQLRPGIDGGMAHADRYPAVREAQKMVCRSSVKAASGAS